MKLTVFGATGTVGQALLKEALAANHTVTALVRSPEKIAAFSDQVNIVVGDYFDADARAQALDGAEAVLSTIGPPMKRAPNNGEYAEAMTALIGQMQSAGIKRIIAVGGAGLRLGDEKLGVPRRIMRLMLRLAGGKGYWDKEQEHKTLCASPLDWTILRPPQVGPASGRFVTSKDGPAAFKADPVQLAGHMIAILNDAETCARHPSSRRCECCRWRNLEFSYHSDKQTFGAAAAKWRFVPQYGPLVALKCRGIDQGPLCGLRPQHPGPSASGGFGPKVRERAL